jgi:hypothetical protein
MKIRLLFLATAAAAVPVLGQTTLSNLGQPVGFSLSPSMDTPFGSPFTTGSFSLGYQLNSITATFSNAGTQFKVLGADIYSDNANSIGSLVYPLGGDGVNGNVGNHTAVFHEYYPAVLAPNTTYWVVFNSGTADHPHTDPNLTMGITLSSATDVADPGWSKPNELQYVGQTLENNVNVPFAVDATAVPEVSTYGMVSAGALCSWAVMRRRKAAKA